MFDLTEVNITKLIAEIQKECSQDMEEKHITSEIILPGDPTVFGNNSLLYSIFRNLYDNAIAYAGENIKITVNCYKEDPKYYYFSFSDNGVGIPEEHINRIFERFYRGGDRLSGELGERGDGDAFRTQGFGIGLSLAQSLISAQGGSLRAGNLDSGGACFDIVFPKVTV